MGFLDAILGRSKPVKPNLDVLFAVPAAALTLQTELDLVPTGAGAVCFRSAEGGDAARAHAEALALIGSAPTETAVDRFGFTWVTVRRADADLSALVTDLHAINTTLADAGYGPGLLCTVIGFTRAADPTLRAGLVYLFKRGTFYPFAPTGEASRDTTLEMQIRAHLTGEVPVETDIGRWFPIWGNPIA